MREVYSIAMPKPIIISKDPTDTLAGYLLVATPQLEGDFFKRSVIYIAEHNKEGAMGIIINAPIDKVSIHDVIEQMELPVSMGDRKMPLLFGGPVEPHRGFVIHNGEHLQDTSLSHRDDITVTANAAVLVGWMHGEFTAKSLLALGYAGWSPGQLESEIEEGSWVVVPATQHLVFDAPMEARWDLAIASLGFDMGNLSTMVGHA